MNPCRFCYYCSCCYCFCWFCIFNCVFGTWVHFMAILCSKTFNSGYKFFYTYQLNEVVLFSLVNHTYRHKHTQTLNGIVFNFGYNKNEIYVLLFQKVGGHVKSGYLLLTLFFAAFYCGNQFACALLIGESLMDFKDSVYFELCNWIRLMSQKYFVRCGFSLK